MGGSSPHCPGGKSSKEDVATRTAFSRLDLSSRGYASKRSPNRNGNVSQLVLNGRAYGGPKSGKRDCGEVFSVKGKLLAYKIIVTAVLVWLLFQTTLLLQGFVLKQQNLDVSLRIPWNDRLRISQHLINTSVVSKLRENTVEVQKKKTWQTLRPPKLALVVPHVGIGPDAVFMVTLARGLQLLGYRLQLYAIKGGAVRSMWEKLGVPVIILGTQPPSVDWSMFDGVVGLSLYSKFALSSLLLEPFRSIPLIWIIQDDKPALEDRVEVTKAMKSAFERAKLVIFPNELLLNTCAQYDTGNFRIIPGSPLEVWEAEEFMTTHSKEDVRSQYGFDAKDFVIAVGSSHSNGIWKAHAMAMHAVAKAVADAKPGGEVQLYFFDHGSHASYDTALKAMGSQFGLVNSSIHYVEDAHVNEILRAADAVIYVSISEEKFFPPILVRAMAFKQVVVAPALQSIQKHIINGVNGFLYPEEDYDALSMLLLKFWRTRPSSHVSSAARLTARNIQASGSIIDYAQVLQTVLEFSSEVSGPEDALRLPGLDWEWNLLESRPIHVDSQRDIPGDGVNNDTSVTDDTDATSEDYEGVLEDEIAQEKALQVMDDVERVEDEELEERKEQAQATFEDVNRGVKRAEREKFEFHERDDGELERTGQPLCIYEPYYGPGAWPFLHQSYPLYRGLSLSPKGRRPRIDDIDAASRLFLLNDTYYRDVLCEFGAYLAIANRIDRIHKNSWIGFQPWSAAGRKVALSRRAETSLVESMKLGTHGDAVYFWAKANEDLDDFWMSCDARNAGSCRSVFLETFKRMYGLKDNAIELPSMPSGAWAGMHCWAMSSASFTEFVMFSRMFLDALDSRLYPEHHDSGTCVLATTKLEAQHCYCRLLEVLVNVWAYHSARKLIYVNPETGLMVEEHPLDSRHGLMKIKWFSFSVLKGMDEDMAEKADEERPTHHWLWPHTGEVFWQGILEREKQERYNLKMERKRRNKERLARMRSRYKQKTLGRYVKPPPGAGFVNETVNATQETTGLSSE